MLHVFLVLEAEVVALLEEEVELSLLVLEVLVLSELESELELELSVLWAVFDASEVEVVVESCVVDS